MKKMNCQNCKGKFVFNWKKVSFPNKKRLLKNQIKALEFLISAGEAGIINLYSGVVGTNNETGAFAIFDNDANVICEFPSKDKQINSKR